MKDFFNQELNIGDIVAFNVPSYSFYTEGTIIGFTPKMVKISYIRGNRDLETKEFPLAVFKKPLQTI